MAPLRSLGNIASIFDDFYARTGTDALDPAPVPILPLEVRYITIMDIKFMCLLQLQ